MKTTLNRSTNSTHLRIREGLPQDWQQVEVGDVADIIVPTRDKPKRFCGEIPWITLPDLNDFFISTAKHLLTHEDAAEVGNRLMPSHTVLLSCAGSLGKIAITTREVYANQQFYGLVAKPNLIEPYFLALSLKTLGEDFFSKLAGVSTVGFFSKDKALGINIPLPPIAEQKRIATIAQKADRLRRTRRYTLELSDSYLRSVFLEVFGDPVTNPSAWEVEKLGSLLESTPQNGLYVAKEKYAEPKSENGIEMVHMSDLFYDVVIPGGLKRVASDLTDISKYFINHHDLLIARRSLVYEGAAKPCRVPKTAKPLVFESSIIRVTPNRKKLSPIYLHYYLSDERARKTYVLKYVTESTISGINQTNLMSIDVVLPPLPLQQKFAQIVHRFERLRTQQREAERQAEHLFQTILDRAFRGEL